MDRRSFLQQVGVAACTAGWASRAFPQDQLSRSLKDAARRCGILYGATDEGAVNGKDVEYETLFARQCALLAPILSWRSVSPKAPVQYEFERRQYVLDFAREHGIKLTGAHLLWHLSTPDYFAAAPDREHARQLVVDHINFMCRKFAGQIWSWNVVNEALNPREGRPGGLRKTPLLDQLGPEFFDIAFHAAREADPKAVLVYNDYDTEYDLPDSEARRRALLELLDSFLKRKLPIDAIGLQAHIKLQNFRFSPSIYRNFLKEIAARGVKILITELDVFDLTAPSDIQERDLMVADAYRKILDVALDETAVTAVITWGITDKYTWLTPRYSPKFGRPDGLPSRPLPFDDHFQPKPAYRTILKAFEAAPKRTLFERS